MTFTKREIERIIKKEEQYIKRLERRIEDDRADIAATKKSVAMWSEMLNEKKRNNEK